MLGSVFASVAYAASLTSSDESDTTTSHRILSPGSTFNGERVNEEPVPKVVLLLSFTHVKVFVRASPSGSVATTLHDILSVFLGFVSLIETESISGAELSTTKEEES